MWWNTLALRGAVTTPTNCDRFDSSCAALAITPLRLVRQLRSALAGGAVHLAAAAR